MKIPKIPLRLPKKPPNLNKDGQISRELGKIYNKARPNNVPQKNVFRIRPKTTRPNRTANIGTNIRPVKTARTANPNRPAMPYQKRQLRAKAYRENRARKWGNNLNAVMSRSVGGNIRAGIKGTAKGAFRLARKHPKTTAVWAGGTTAYQLKKKRNWNNNKTAEQMNNGQLETRSYALKNNIIRKENRVKKSERNSEGIPNRIPDSLDVAGVLAGAGIGGGGAYAVRREQLRAKAFPHAQKALAAKESRDKTLKKIDRLDKSRSKLSSELKKYTHKSKKRYNMNPESYRRMKKSLSSPTQWDIRVKKRTNRLTHMPIGKGTKASLPLDKIYRNKSKSALDNVNRSRKKLPQKTSEAFREAAINRSIVGKKRAKLINNAIELSNAKKRLGNQNLIKKAISGQKSSVNPDKILNSISKKSAKLVSNSQKSKLILKSIGKIDKSRQALSASAANDNAIYNASRDMMKKAYKTRASPRNLAIGGALAGAAIGTALYRVRNANNKKKVARRIQQHHMI